MSEPSPESIGGLLDLSSVVEETPEQDPAPTELSMGRMV